ncbi:hypothetical protein CQW23_09661 [Capsicum baccatum]|uniref:Uncharacterized protein n=1 Tax=Capsicum baccatum TaxID=33114 RepID=A0A2G2WXE5_CAPBA|nr:hypothetical protein CQW23_09661 [Capsicum baccatum]
MKLLTNSSTPSSNVGLKLYVNRAGSFVVGVQKARALLRKLEYQRGKFDAALQVFQGVAKRTRSLKPNFKGDIVTAGVMSLDSGSLLLEEILVKEKYLEELSQIKAKTVCPVCYLFFHRLALHF